MSFCKSASTRAPDFNQLIATAFNTIWVIKKMSDDRFYRGRKAIEFIENGQILTLYALSAHSSIVCGSNAYLCDPEGWM